MKQYRLTWSCPCGNSHINRGSLVAMLWLLQRLAFDGILAMSLEDEAFAMEREILATDDAMANHEA